MEIVTIKFTKPTAIAGGCTYREGETAGFSRQLADQIIKRGHGVENKPEARPGKGRGVKKDMQSDDSSTYETK